MSNLRKIQKDKMSMNNHSLNKRKKWISFLLIGLSINLINKPSYAFIPYYYETNIDDLKKTSISLAKSAAQLIQFGQAKEASRLARVAVKLNPYDERLWSILAEAQVRNKLFKDAKYSLTKAKEINPKNANLWFAEGSIELQQKNPKKAILLFEKGLSIEPENANAYFQIGNARLIQSKSRLALQAFEKATKIKPKFWEALNNQGLVLFELGKIDKAINIWRKVLEINKNPEPMLALAVALNKQQKSNSESIDLAKEALARNPNYVSPQHQKEQLWGDKLIKATKDFFKKPELNKDIQRALANSK